MTPIVVSSSPGTVRYTPLRRAFPAGDARGDRWHTALLVVAGLVAFVDIEFGLAYLLYYAARLLA